MKKKFTLPTLILICMLPVANLKAQCVADINIMTQGVYPNLLQKACENKPYQQTITVVIDADTVLPIPFGGNVVVPYDSLVVVVDLGLLPGLTATCNPVNCTKVASPPFTSPLRLCIDISGTPASLVANNIIRVVRQKWLTVSGTATALITTDTINVNLPRAENTAGTLTHTDCESVTINGTLYSFSGVYTQTLTNSNGCDSLLTINLTINAPYTAVSVAGETLTSSEIGAGYQWIDCTTQQIISGATNQTFTATANGSYAVIVSKGGCSDTSTCYNIAHLGIAETAFGDMLRLYPNPTKDNFTIYSSAMLQNAEVFVTDVSGALVSRNIFDRVNEIPVSLNTEVGIYFVEVKTAGYASAKFRVLKY